jgi:hypothetical protein
MHGANLAVSSCADPVDRRIKVDRLPSGSPFTYWGTCGDARSRTTGAKKPGCYDIFAKSLSKSGQAVPRPRGGLNGSAATHDQCWHHGSMRTSKDAAVSIESVANLQHRPVATSATARPHSTVPPRDRKPRAARCAAWVRQAAWRRRGFSCQRRRGSGSGTALCHLPACHHAPRSCCRRALARRTVRCTSMFLISSHEIRGLPTTGRYSSRFKTQFVAEQDRVKLWQRRDCWRLPPNVKTSRRVARSTTGHLRRQQGWHSSGATHPLAYRPLCAQSQ